MKIVGKGILFGIALVIVAMMCSSGYTENSICIISCILFFITAYRFLVADSLAKLLICGFIGAGMMFVLQIFALPIADFLMIHFSDLLVAYVGGFFGSMVALLVSIVETVRREKGGYFVKDIEPKDKRKLLIYTFISAISFAWLVMPQKSGISLIFFVLIQFICLGFFVKDRKKLLYLLPIMIMAINGFISANSIWRIPNLFVSTVIYSCIFAEFDIKDSSLAWIGDLSGRVIRPINTFNEPFVLLTESGSDKAGVIKRVLIALAIALPGATILILVLANADMVFSLRTEQFIEMVGELISLRSIYVICSGIIAGLYLYGVVRGGVEAVEKKEVKTKNGDLIIINILLAVAIIIYALFSVVQFKYLFATAQLPEGLSYTEYARKGFFELLALTGVNIAGILVAIRLSKNQNGIGVVVTKLFCHCLCGMTVLLLISSFYRMCLYTNDGGLTRMRLYVLGFLIFEALGLIVSFVYIQKPRFNIVMVYSIIALCYYLTLNIVPTDSVIAYDQVQRCLDGRSNDIAYAASLSEDAVPAMEVLIKSTDNEEVREIALNFIKYSCYGDIPDDIPDRWQRFNISRTRAEKIRVGLFSE